MIRRAIKYGDDIDKVEGIDDDLCSNDIIEMYKEIPNHESHTDIENNTENSFLPTENTTINQEDQADVDNSSIDPENNEINLADVENSSIDPENTTVNQSDECIEFVRKLVETKIGKGPLTPFSIIKLLREMNKPITFCGNVINKTQVVQYLQTLPEVPVKQRALFCLAKRQLGNLFHPNVTWSELSVCGKKGFLDQKDIKVLVEKIKNDTISGKSIGFSTLKKIVNDAIIDKYRKKNELHLLPVKISNECLISYVDKIRSQSGFLSMMSVLNKTKNRSIAECSVRSTISYAITVATTHFLPNIQESIYHPKKKELSNEAMEMWNLSEKYYNRMIGNSDIVEKLYPVLPNLVTSTDEITIFATTTNVLGKERYYITARPEDMKNEMCDSSCTNNYTTEMSGDSHCRGVRIVINNTFTAGGITAPIFVTVYGLTLEEMPGDPIVTIKVPGLIVGSFNNVDSTGEGYINFVRGSNNITDESETQLTSIRTNSVESQIADLYRKTVYYNLIRKIREREYGWSGDEENIPDHLQAISWMDGANAQLKLITSHDNLMREKKMKITTNKHSASRTGVEQAADAGCMFKCTKQQIPKTNTPHVSNNGVYFALEKEINALINNSRDATGRVLNLLKHKKKAILMTVSKLPIAAARAYSSENICKAFMRNGQVDIEMKLVPNLANIFHTYRGSQIDGQILNERDKLFDLFYKEAYVNGIIKENCFDRYSVPNDQQSANDTFTRDIGVALENRQQAKTLSNNVQIQERKDLITQKKIDHVNKCKTVYENEDKLYRNNTQCEKKICQTVHHRLNLSVQTEVTNNLLLYDQISNNIILNDFTNSRTKINNIELQAFIKVRTEARYEKGKFFYSKIPSSKKADLIKRAFELCRKKINNKFIPELPTIENCFNTREFGS